MRLFAKVYHFVILNEVQDLNLLKMRAFASLRMTISHKSEFRK
jgi:hypothetical protein